MQIREGKGGGNKTELLTGNFGFLRVESHELWLSFKVSKSCPALNEAGCQAHNYILCPLLWEHPLFFIFFILFILMSPELKIGPRRVFICTPLEATLYFIYLFFWLRWVFVAARGLSSCGERRLLFLAACGLLIAVASLVAEHGLSCSAACGIFPAQGLNPCPLHWQVDS